MSSYLVLFGLIVDAAALCLLVCARFSALEWTRPWTLLRKLIWSEWSDYQGDYDTSFFYLTNLPQSWFQIFFIAVWKKYGTLFFMSICKSEKSPWPSSLLWFIQKGMQLLLLLCSGLVLEVHDFAIPCMAAWMDDMKACNCNCCTKCSTFSIITG